MRMINRQGGRGRVFGKHVIMEDGEAMRRAVPVALVGLHESISAALILRDVMVYVKQRYQAGITSS